jgi:hypothetical protein
LALTERNIQIREGLLDIEPKARPSNLQRHGPSSSGIAPTRGLNLLAKRKGSSRLSK